MTDQGEFTNNSGKDTVILEREFVSKGAVIVREGDQGDCAYLVQAGSVDVYVEDEGKKTVLAHMGAGQIFGEMALVFDEYRVATVEAAEDCMLIPITREMFQSKLDKSDPTIRAIVPMLLKRIIQSNNLLLHKQSSVESLLETVNAVYQNISTALPAVKKRSLQNTVLPPLKDFIKSVRAFQARYKDE